MWEFFVSYGYSLFTKVIKCFIVRSKRRAWPASRLVYDQSAAKKLTDVPPYLYPGHWFRCLVRYSVTLARTFYACVLIYIYIYFFNDSKFFFPFSFYMTDTPWWPLFLVPAFVSLALAINRLDISVSFLEKNCSSCNWKCSTYISKFVSNVFCTRLILGLVFTTANSSKADVSSVSPSSDRTSLLGQFTSSTQLIMIPPPPTPSPTQHQSFLETYAFSHP